MSDTTLSSVGEYLQSIISGIANVYVGSLPALDLSGIAVQLYNGGTSKQFFGGSESLFYINVLVHFRSHSYSETASWCDRVQGMLHGYNKDNVLGAQLVGGSIYLGTTIEKLHEFQQTYRMIIKE